MLEVIKRCFQDKLTTGGWADGLRKMIPSYGQSLIDNPAMTERLRTETAAVLHINNVKKAASERSAA